VRYRKRKLLDWRKSARRNSELLQLRQQWLPQAAPGALANLLPVAGRARAPGVLPLGMACGTNLPPTSHHELLTGGCPPGCCLLCKLTITCNTSYCFKKM